MDNFFDIIDIKPAISWSLIYIQALLLVHVTTYMLLLISLLITYIQAGHFDIYKLCVYTKSSDKPRIIFLFLMELKI